MAKSCVGALVLLFCAEPASARATPSSQPLPATMPTSMPAGSPASQPTVTCPVGTTASEEAATDEDPERSSFCVDKNGVPQGPVVSWHGDTDVRSFEGTFVAGKLHGPFRTWGPSGRLRRTGQYRQGKLHGTATTYHENGTRAVVETWNNGRLTTRREWDPKGTLIPALRMMFRGVSAGSQARIRNAVDLRDVRAALAKAASGAALAALEFRWDGRWQRLVVLYHIPVHSIPRATLQGHGYLDEDVVTRVSGALMPFNIGVAEAVGASEFGSPGLVGRIRLAGKSRAVEFEMNCLWSAHFCQPPNSLECFQAGRRPVTTVPESPYTADGDRIVDIQIADPVDLGGKETGTRCFHDLWK